MAQKRKTEFDFSVSSTDQLPSPKDPKRSTKESQRTLISPKRKSLGNHGSTSSPSSSNPIIEGSCLNLWQVLIGHSALRDPVVIRAEVERYSGRLVRGLAYYKQPSPSSELQLKSSQKAKGKKLQFVLEISQELHLDELQSCDLFQLYLFDSYRGSFEELDQKLTSVREKRTLLKSIQTYYFSERLHVLRSLKHLIGYWQDKSHPYRAVYETIYAEACKDETTLISGVWCQYESCVNAELPANVQSREDEAAWIVQNLREQCELLEIALLYFKDFYHQVPFLLDAAKRFQTCGFGMRQHSRAGLVPGTEALTTHLSHLCCLLMVEAIDLETLQTALDTPETLAEHHLLKAEVSSQFEELDVLVSEWGDVPCHVPVLLAWSVFKHIAQPKGSLDNMRLLGNRALKGGVFSYMHSIVQSPRFTGDRPVATVAKAVVHTVLSLCVTSFSEESLGDTAAMVAIATETLTHPCLRLEFWEKGVTTGTGLLVASALTRFPLESCSLLTLLRPLARDAVSSRHVYSLLSAVPHYTEALRLEGRGDVRVPSGASGEWLLSRSLRLYGKESLSLGCEPLTLPAGVRGRDVGEGGDGQVVCWDHSYSAWELFTLTTSALLHSTAIGKDFSQHPLVVMVTNVAELITEILLHNWSLATKLRPITSQYFGVIQKLSPLPTPPSHLLSACLRCLAAMATNNCEEVWQRLGRTGFLPYLRFSCDDVSSVAVAPGHFGHLLNVWERPRGVYPITMAMLDLLLSGSLPSNSLATNEVFACVVFVMKEIFSGFHNWRYRSLHDRDEIANKLLQLCHNILKTPRTGKNNQRDFLCHFLSQTSGGHALLSVLALGVDVVDRLYNSAQCTSQPVLRVETLTLAFSVLDLLLVQQKRAGGKPTPLEQALVMHSLKRSVDGSSVPSPVHLVAVIASYIHHHDNPNVPTGATRLLARLSQVAPMSLFASLGQHSVAVRDAYVRRLDSRVEDVGLKVEVLGLVKESVCSQPGLMELFLSIRSATPPSSLPGKPGVSYSMDAESCLHAVLRLIDSQPSSIPRRGNEDTPPPRLLLAGTSLLRALWSGRHDAALIALRAHRHFWRSLTVPLFRELWRGEGGGGGRGEEEGEEGRGNFQELSYEMLVVADVMHIVSMETYYVYKNNMDVELVALLKEFASSNRYQLWFKSLHSLSPTTDDDSPPHRSPPHCSPPPLEEPASAAQLQLARAWSSFLLVASAAQEAVYQLSVSALRETVLEGGLEALESQVSATPPSRTTVAIATELSLLYLVLLRRWSHDLELRGDLIGRFDNILKCCSKLECSDSVQLCVSLYSILILLLKTLRHNSVHMEPRFLLGLIPYISETLQNHHIYIRMELKHRPDVSAVYLLTELLQSLSGPAVWLQSLRQFSMVTVLIATLDEHLKLKTDEGFLEAAVGVLLLLSRYPEGAEALLVNGVAQPLCISLADALMVKLEAARQEKQTATPAIVKPTPLSSSSSSSSSSLRQWQSIWLLSVKLTSSLLSSLRHHFIPHALSFVGVFAERLTKALDVFELIKDLDSLEQTRTTCQFFQELAAYQKQWKFSLGAHHDLVINRVILLLSTSVAVLSKRATMKHIIRTMHTSGLLPPSAISQSAAADRRRARRRTLSAGGAKTVDFDDDWIMSSPAFTQLEEGLVSIVTSCLSTLHCYSPRLDELLLEGHTLELSEYPFLFTLSLDPPTVDLTTPPSLATMTTCLSIGLSLLNRLEPHRVGTPSKSPGRSPSTSSLPHPHSLTHYKRGVYLCFLERAILLLLSQATLYLVDPSVESHDKQVLKKKLANELGDFSQGLLRNFTRKGAPSPGGSFSKSPSGGGQRSSIGGGASFLDTSSGKTSSFIFSDSSEQGIFKLADSFTKQFFR